MKRFFATFGLMILSFGSLGSSVTFAQEETNETVTETPQENIGVEVESEGGEGRTKTDGAKCPPNHVGKYCVKIDTFTGSENIIADNGIELWKEFISRIYKMAAGIIGLICVLIIVFSGMQMSLGGLSSEGVNQAKERIMQALLSLILLFGTALLLQVINPGFFGAQEVAPAPGPAVSIEPTT